MRNEPLLFPYSQGVTQQGQLSPLCPTLTGGSNLVTPMSLRSNLRILWGDELPGVTSHRGRRARCPVWSFADMPPRSPGVGGQPPKEKPYEGMSTDLSGASALRLWQQILSKRNSCTQKYLGFRGTPPSPCKSMPPRTLPLPLPQERKAGNRAKSLHNSQELVGLAQFLDKHQEPWVPSRYFHSWGQSVTTALVSLCTPIPHHLGTAGRGLCVASQVLGE